MSRVLRLIDLESSVRDKGYHGSRHFWAAGHTLARFSGVLRLSLPVCHKLSNCALRFRSILKGELGRVQLLRTALLAHVQPSRSGGRPEYGMISAKEVVLEYIVPILGTIICE